MKRMVCIGFLWVLSLSVVAQNSLCLSTDKTTSLVFPFPVKHVDRGTPVVLAQQVKEVPNILLVKAGAKDFPETNLSVATEDGSLYSFAVCYDPKPSAWVFHLPVQVKESLKSGATALLDNPGVIRGIRDRKWGMCAKVTGIYVKDDVLFYQLALQNDSPLDYAIERIRFFVADKKKSKRTAVQELDLKPLHSVGNTALVKARNATVLVVALDKFTIPDARYLGVQIMEKNGGRHLSMKINNRDLMDALILPEWK